MRIRLLAGLALLMTTLWGCAKAYETSETRRTTGWTGRFAFQQEQEYVIIE